MRPQIKDIGILVLMIGAGILLQWQWSGLAERMDSLAASKKEFAQRAQEAITTPEKDGYLGRIQSFLQVYKKDVTETQAGRVAWSEEMRERAERQLENAAIDEAQYEEKTKVLALVKRSYETLLDARWKSQLTLPGEGNTRLDIYRVEAQRDSEGKAVLVADFFLWGIEADTQVTWGPTELKYWPAPAVARQGGTSPQAAEVEASAEADGPLVATKGDGTSGPAMFVKQPTRIFRQFPSYVAIGTLRLPPVPDAAKLMDFKFQYAVKKGEDENVTQLDWKQVPIPAAWRVSAAEAKMAN